MILSRAELKQPLLRGSLPGKTMTPKAAALFHGSYAGHRDHVILRSRAAANSNRADDLAIDHERIPAARHDHIVQRRQIGEEIAFPEQTLEHHCRSAITRRSPRLVLRYRYGSKLAAVRLLEIHKISGWCDDSDAQALPIALGRFSRGGGCHLFGGLQSDRLAVRRDRLRIRHGLVRIVRIGGHLCKGTGADKQCETDRAYCPT